MIWLNIRNLENKLAKREISERTGSTYLLSLLIVLSIASFLPETDPDYPSYWWDLIALLLEIAITVWGIRKVFRTNKSGGEQDFLKRFLSLAFVNGLRVFLAVLAVYLLYKIIMFVIPLPYFHFFNDLMTNDYVELVLRTILYFLFYLLMIRSFRRVNSLQQKVDNE